MLYSHFTRVNQDPERREQLATARVKARPQALGLPAHAPPRCPDISPASNSIFKVAENKDPSFFLCSQASFCLQHSPPSSSSGAQEGGDCRSVGGPSCHSVSSSASSTCAGSKPVPHLVAPVPDPPSPRWRVLEPGSIGLKGKRLDKDRQTNGQRTRGFPLGSNQEPHAPGPALSHLLCPPSALPPRPARNCRSLYNHSATGFPSPRNQEKPDNHGRPGPSLLKL